MSGPNKLGWWQLFAFQKQQEEARRKQEEEHRRKLEQEALRKQEQKRQQQQLEQQKLQEEQKRINELRQQQQQQAMFRLKQQQQELLRKKEMQQQAEMQQRELQHKLQQKRHENQVCFLSHPIAACPPSLKACDCFFLKTASTLTGFSFSARPLANASVKTDGWVEIVGHSLGLASWIFISRKETKH